MIVNKIYTKYCNYSNMFQKLILQFTTWCQNVRISDDLANSAAPDQTALRSSLIMDYTVCCITSSQRLIPITVSVWCLYLFLLIVNYFD